MTNPITINSTKTVTSIIRNGTAIEKMMLAWEWQPQGFFLGDVQGAWYDPVNTANEDWRRNLLSPSNAVGGVSFYANPITKNAAGPDGSANSAFTLLAKNPGGSDQVAVTVSLNNLATETTHTISVFLKSNGLGWGTVYLTNFESTITFKRAYFDLVNGEVGSIDPIYSGSGIEPAGNGFFRCWVSFKTISDQNGTFNIGIADGNNDAFVPLDGVSSMIMSDLQLEVGSSPTAYQPITDVNTEVRALFPNTTMFQDSVAAPTASASATTSQTVGLWLDKSKDLVLGPELVTNGNFAAGTTGWAQFVATIAENNGRLQVTPTDGSSRSGYQGITTVIGKLYKVTAKYDQGTTTGVLFRVRNNAANSTIVFTSATFIGSGTTEFSFVAGSTLSILELATATVNTGNSGYFDDISVREIMGNHAVQASISLRPLFGRSPVSGRRNVLTQTESLATVYSARTGVTLNFSSLSYGSLATTLVKMDTALSVHTIGPAQGAWAVGTYTVSLVVKDAGARYVQIDWGNGGNPNNAYINFDIVSGDIGSSLHATGTITPLGDNWYRLTATLEQDGVGAQHVLNFIPTLTSTRRPTFSGDGISGVYVAAPQLELGTVATPYQKVVSALDVTEAGKPSYAFIRPDLSDDKLTTNMASTKNLIRYSEEFDNAVWLKLNGTTVKPNLIMAPDGTISADKIVEAIATTNHVLRQATTPVTIGQTYTASCAMKAGERTWAALGLRIGNYAYFDLSTGQKGTVGGGGGGGSSSISPLGDGWYLCSVTYTFPINTTTGVETYAALADNVGNYLGDGASGIYVWGAQLELGSVATSYEYGGFKGDVVVAGKNGTAYETNVTSPTGIMDLGPLTYTGGTPGILRAVGDITGYTMARKKFSDVEKAQLVRYYKKRGAKGMLVEGPEALANGYFTLGTSGYTGTVSASAGNMTVTTTGGFQGTSCTFSAVSGQSYKLTFSITSNTANWSIGVGNGIGFGQDYGSPQYTSPQTVTVYFKSTVTGLRTLWLYAYAAATINVDYFSVKEVRPEEEW